MKTVSDIRNSFFDYFVKNNHEKVSSSSLVPDNDATLMFINAGMVQFKNVFTGLEQRSYNRAVTVQKCVRAGGKHNDLDNVGYTARHHTFFEMMGNFSFGDYFKEQAIYYAWNFLTKILCLPPQKLLVTIYHDDEEAKALWKKIAGLSDAKIIPISSCDNFWSMGDTGPCGPCSEIFYDHGEEIAGGPPGSAEEDGDRFIEIWNLVFMQYDQISSEERVTLPKPSIDTGAGIERVAAVLQHVYDNYEIDLFKSIISAIEDATSVKAIKTNIVSHKVIADHLRAMSFLIADGVLPSNEKRGYVLRRIMRRAMRHAHLLGVTEPVIWKLLPSLITEMGEAYPQLIQSKNFIEETIKSEEERFGDTLHRGLDILNNELKHTNGLKKFNGKTAFKLYDTYGFPLDLTQDILKTHNLEVDIDSFNYEMAEQKRKARKNWAGSGDITTESIWFDLKKQFNDTIFLGYEHDNIDATIKAIVKNNAIVDSAACGDECYIILDKTVFYAESGGQVSDIGFIETSTAKLEVVDVQKKLDTLFVHKVKIVSGNISKNDKISLQINVQNRKKTAANHSATHLLHKALRVVLGENVHQKGSLVMADALRFDFSYNKALTSEQITKVENLVNNVIKKNTNILTQELSLNDAKKQGVMALFSEKYGDIVRLVSMGESDGDYWSKELCGGTHSKTTGDIAFFKITAQRSVASGIRRIEALTKEAAINYNEKNNTDLDLFLNYMPIASFANVAKLLLKLKQDKAALIGTNDNNSSDVFYINDIAVTNKIFFNLSPRDLKPLADKLKSEFDKSIIILFSVAADNKVSLVVGVSDNLLDKYNAVDLVHIAVPILGGKGGGGRPNMAQAGGNEGSKSRIVAQALLDHIKFNYK